MVRGIDREDDARQGDAEERRRVTRSTRDRDCMAHAQRPTQVSERSGVATSTPASHGADIIDVAITGDGARRARRDKLRVMSLVSVLTRESARSRLSTASRWFRHPSPALAGVAAGGISASEPRARDIGCDETCSGSSANPHASPAARRIEAGHVGDPLALDGYVERARRVAALSLGAGTVMAVIAVAVDPLGWLPATLLALGAGFDWARGRLGARVLIQGGVLVIRRGPWGGARLRRDDIESIGFGPSGRVGQRGRESSWRGGVESQGASHLVVLRLKGSGPRRLIVPEAGVGEARAAVRRLRRWWSSARA
jgi:hypothetical protein